MRVLVTGGCGFIGSHLAKRLFSEGHDVAVVDIKDNPFMKYQYYSKKYLLDLRDYRNCLKLTKDMDQVYHFAANMGGIGYITEIGADIVRDNSWMNINMLEASRINNVKTFLFSSSACIYPKHKQYSDPHVFLKEEDAYPADPDEYYGWEKLFMEKACEAYTRDYSLETRVARFHNIYGPEGTYDGGKEKSPAALCRKAARYPQEDFVIWGDGKQVRSYCYVDDCVDGLTKLMNSDIRQPINLGTDEAVTLDELADLIIKISGKSMVKKHDLSKPQGVRFRNADISLARKVLGWEPRVSLKEGLTKTYKWIELQYAQGLRTGKIRQKGA